MKGGDAPPTAEFSREEWQRYSRHLLLDEVGRGGQRALKRAAVLVVGVGGLGSPVALYLAAAGVGRIGLVDADRVDVTNLQRQVIYSTAQTGRSKVLAARERLLELNPHITVEVYPEAFSASNAMDLYSWKATSGLACSVWLTSINWPAISSMYACTRALSSSVVGLLIVGPR